MYLEKLLQHFIKWEQVELVWHTATARKARMGQVLNNTFQVLIKMFKNTGFCGMT